MYVDILSCTDDTDVVAMTRPYGKSNYFCDGGLFVFWPQYLSVLDQKIT